MTIGGAMPDRAPWPVCRAPMVWLETVCAGCGYAASCPIIGKVGAGARAIRPGMENCYAAAVDDICRAHDRGEISAEGARNKIFDFAGGIGMPEWARSGIDTRSPTRGSTYR
jgi:hypothetical protein